MILKLQPSSISSSPAPLLSANWRRRRSFRFVGFTSTYTRNAARLALGPFAPLNADRKAIGGLITAITSPEAGRSWTYGYDGLDRLISAANTNTPAESRSFAYDAADNMTTNSGLCAGTGNLIYPATGAARPHAPTSICGAAVTYDANGNTLSYDSDGAGPNPSKSFVYDLENRPIAVTQSGVTTTFQYGADTERVAKTLGNTTTHYLGNDAEATIDAASPQGRITSYINSNVRKDNGAYDFLVKDHLASNRLSQRFNGATTRHDYGPYGKPLTTNGAFSPGGGRGYINERHDPETNLQYLNARYYDPHLGRFLTPDWWDPEIEGVDINRYAYGLNDPINLSDPNGHITTIAGLVKSILGSSGSSSGSNKNNNAKQQSNQNKKPELKSFAPYIPHKDRVKKHNVDDDYTEFMLEKYGCGNGSGCMIGGPGTAAGKSGTKAAPKTTAATKDLHRPYTRKPVREQVEQNAPRDALGRPIDPNTRQPIMVKPDLGHKRGNEFWRERGTAKQEGLTQKQFNDRMNDPRKYQLEDPISNRSRIYELP